MKHCSEPPAERSGRSAYNQFCILRIYQPIPLQTAVPCAGSHIHDKEFF